MLRSFSERLMVLLNMLDHEHQLSHQDRITMYQQLLGEVTPEDDAQLFNDIIHLLKQFHTELEGHPYLDHFESLFKRWIPERRKHVYLNGQNVHIFTGSSVQVALRIMIDHPQPYFRPFNHPFFDVIENCDPISTRCSHEIHLTTLFASIFHYIMNHEFKESLMERLVQEMDESQGMCVMGHFTRLVNSVSGFNDYDIILDDFEADKARVFHYFNTHIDLFDVDTISRQIMVLLTTKEFNIDTTTMMRILHDYTQQSWSVKQGRFIPSIGA